MIVDHLDGNRLLRAKRVLSLSEDVQTLHHLVAEAVFGKHAFHGLLHRAGGFLGEQRLHGDLLHTAWVRGVAVVDLVAGLFRSDSNLGRIDHDDVIAMKLVRRELRLVLAAKDMCRLCGDATEHLAVGINQKPLWRCRLWRGSFHFLETLEESLTFFSALSAFPAFSGIAPPIVASINVRSTIFAPSPLRAPTAVMRVIPEERVA